MYPSLSPLTQEYSKGQLKQENHRAATVSPILHHCLMTSLRLLSPMMPFISEELYQRLMAEGSGGAAGTDVTASLTISEYPRSQDVNIGHGSIYA